MLKNKIKTAKVPLKYLLSQSISGWQLSEATETKVTFKPIECEDELAAIEFHPRLDNPEKAYALFKGKNIHSNGQEIFFQKEIKPAGYLGVAASMYEMMFLDEDGFDF
jgi:hypothetical protein